MKLIQLTIAGTILLGTMTTSALADPPKVIPGCRDYLIKQAVGTVKGGPLSGWVHAKVTWCWNRSGVTSHRVDITRDETYPGKAVGFTWKDDFVATDLDPYGQPTQGHELKGSYAICPLKSPFCLRKHYIYINYVIDYRRNLRWSVRQT